MHACLRTKVASSVGHSSAEVTKRAYSVVLPGDADTVAAEVGAQVTDYFGNRMSSRSERDSQFKSVLERVIPDAAALLEGKVKGKIRGK